MSGASALLPPLICFKGCGFLACGGGEEAAAANVLMADSRQLSLFNFQGLLIKVVLQDCFHAFQGVRTEANCSLAGCFQPLPAVPFPGQVQGARAGSERLLRMRS